MTTKTYYERLLPYYRSCFDMEEPYDLCGMECLSHGYFYSHSEKYVLTREARLWESNSFEHVFFIEKDVLEEADLEEMDRRIREYVEPVLVRKNEKYPEKDHMYTYVTFVFLCGSAPKKDVVKLFMKYSFTKNYLFTFRGFCQVRVVLADMENEMIMTNRAGKALLKLYKKAMKQRDRLH